MKSEMVTGDLTCEVQPWMCFTSYGASYGAPIDLSFIIMMFFMLDRRLLNELLVYLQQLGVNNDTRTLRV